MFLFKRGFYMRSLLVIVLGLLAVTASVDANHPSDPYKFVKEVASATFSRMKKDQALINENRNELKIIVEHELMPHVDHNYSALFVLGNNVKTLPKDKIEEFAEVFKDYLMATYAISLGYYNNQMVEFEPTKPYDGKKLVSIKALIKEVGRKNINVIFQVRQNKMGQWKAIDMTAEGVSVIQTKRAEFTPMIRQKGIDSVIALMKEKSDKPLENKPKK
jgi:phospholipid transport system substrate-binding protein